MNNIVPEKKWEGLVCMGDYDYKLFFWKHNRDFHFHTLFIFKSISIKLEEKDRKKKTYQYERGFKKYF